MNKELRVFKPEVYVEYSWLKLPNLYVELNDEDDGDFYTDNEVVIRYLIKEYGKDYLKQIICDAIDKGEVKINICVSDTDCYDYEDVIKSEDNPEILTHEEFMDLKKKFIKI